MFAGILMGVAPSLLHAQDTTRTRHVSLDEAVHIAEQVSQPVAIARAGVALASGQQTVARSQILPQITGQLSYTRTLATQFASLGRSTNTTPTQAPPPDCTPFADNPAWTPEQRTDSLEAAVNRALQCPVAGNPFTGVSNLPFGQANQYQFGFNISQNLFAGGANIARIHAANANRESANISLTSARAQMIIDVATAYYDAVLSERLVEIADSTLAQDERTLSQVQLANQVGNAAEFDLLNAQVTRNNQLPIVIQQRANRSVAYLHLKQLLQLPLDDSLDLTTALDDTSFTEGTRLASLVTATPDTATLQRAPVREAYEAMQAQQSQLTVTRAQRIPSLTLSTDYSRVAYPRNGLPGWSNFLTNWTVTAAVQVPIFLGGSIRGNKVIAEANLEQARATYRQTQQLAALDTRNAVALLAAAEASWQASSGTVDQATKAYTIAEVRYREGISTQTELGSSRLLLQQARANRAQAARDLQVARLRVALIHDLPLGSTTGQPATTTTPNAATMLQQMGPTLTTPSTPQQPTTTVPGTSVAASRTGGVP
ncbi:MAG TPA: TolC family protein [Gemmatimonadaceae bacterium]|nr:TolC family protein [Gemmatimonadaceae bacterium]